MSTEKEKVLNIFNTNNHNFLWDDKDIPYELDNYSSHNSNIMKVEHKICFKLGIDIFKLDNKVLEDNKIEIFYPFTNDIKEQEIKDPSKKIMFVDPGGYSSSPIESKILVNNLNCIIPSIIGEGTINIQLTKESFLFNNIPENIKKIFEKQYLSHHLKFIKKQNLSFYPYMTIVNEKQILVKNKIINELINDGDLNILDGKIIDNKNGNVKASLHKNDWEKVKGLFTNFYINKNYGNADINEMNLRDYNNYNYIQTIESFLFGIGKKKYKRTVKKSRK